MIDANTLFTQDDYANASAALIELTGSVNGKDDTGANADDGIVAGTIENNKGNNVTINWRYWYNSLLCRRWMRSCSCRCSSHYKEAYEQS